MSLSFVNPHTRTRGTHLQIFRTGKILLLLDVVLLLLWLPVSPQCFIDWQHICSSLEPMLLPPPLLALERLESSGHIPHIKGALQGPQVAYNFWVAFLQRLHGGEGETQGSSVT